MSPSIDSDVESIDSHVAERLYRGVLIRAVEEELLKLFAAGKLAGTTHTCIGQEMSAVILAESLDRQRDLIFSNHRCHGHYLAWTDDAEGLIAEVMGRRSGVCGGLGGSQHLCGERFFSNGIQGGIVPVAAGLAFAQKLAGEGGIVAVCIGDGTLGEGVIYETFNIAVKWNLPLLVLLENNLYAQSTSQHETLAGDIGARAAAFGMRTFQGDTWNHSALAQQVRLAADTVRTQSVPCFVEVKTYRLGAHSKGDDDRSRDEIEEYSRRDPINIFLEARPAKHDPHVAEISARVAAAVERANSEPAQAWTPPAQLESSAERPVMPEQLAAGTQLECINRALMEWMSADPAVIVLGEDIRSPYGGAFKVTRGLSDAFPERVLNTPISEAAIVGLANGLGLGGRRAIVEIMFGDFLTLCCDQILNHAAKFHGMYNGRVSTPIVLRTPMGGGRGYGPTHSQNLEKHFVGIPGITVLVLHGRVRMADLYRGIRAQHQPVLLIENKLLYREREDAPVPSGYIRCEHGAVFPTTILRMERADAPADLTIVAFGRMSALVERAIEQLAAEEVSAEVLLPVAVSPLDVEPILASVTRTRKLLVVEEGAAGFDLASEVIAAVSVGYRGAQRLHVRRLAAHPVPIPSAVDLERQVLPSEKDVTEACLELFDA